MNKTAALLELSGVTKSFGTNKALQGVDLQIRKGDSLVLIGSSGSGKTLVLKCIMGLIPHDDGLIAFKGRDITTCLLYTSPSPRDATLSRMPSSA